MATLVCMLTNWSIYILKSFTNITYCSSIKSKLEYLHSEIIHQPNSTYMPKTYCDYYCVESGLRFCFYFLYASVCTAATALPEGSFRFLKASSHSRAILVLQATLASWGTDKAAASLGKCSLKIDR